MRWLFLFCLLLAPFANATIDPFCQTVWTEADVSPYAPEFGTPSKQYSSKTADAYIIGEGIHGVKIIRIIPKDKTQPSYVIKQYRGADGRVKFERDFAAMQILMAAAKLDTEKKSFHVAETEDLRPRRFAMKVADVRGRDLETVLKDSEIPIEQRKKMAAEFNDRVSALEPYLRAIEGVTHVEKSAANWIGGSKLVKYKVTDNSGKVTELYLSVSQAIVSFDKADPTRYQFTLVDGY